MSIKVSACHVRTAVGNDNELRPLLDNELEDSENEKTQDVLTGEIGSLISCCDGCGAPDNCSLECVCASPCMRFSNARERGDVELLNTILCETEDDQEENETEDDQEEELDVVASPEFLWCSFKDPHPLYVEYTTTRQPCCVFHQHVACHPTPDLLPVYYCERTSRRNILQQSVRLKRARDITQNSSSRVQTVLSVTKQGLVLKKQGPCSSVLRPVQPVLDGQKFSRRFLDLEREVGYFRVV